MNTLRQNIDEARQKKTAIGHFNISTLDGVFAVADAGRELGVPVIIGVSEGERDYTGVRQIAAVVQSLRAERNQPIYLNADHTYSYDRVREAIDAGFDAVIFDGAQLSLVDNIAVTRKCVDYARASGRDIVVEGELGFIGSSSKVLDAIPEGAVVGESQMTSSADAVRFVTETGVDLLAPAVGNIHGLVRGGDPALSAKRVKDISQATGLGLVLHGASGNTADDIAECVRAGIAIVHVNTELRLAYRSGLVKSLSEYPDEVAPYKYLRPARLAMQKIITEKLKILQNS